MKAIAGFLIVVVLAFVLYVWLVKDSEAPVVVEDQITSENTDNTAVPETSEDVDSMAEAAADTITDTDTTADAVVDADTDTVTDAESGSVKEFTVDAFSYGYSLDTIEVNEGDTVRITLTNSGGMHDWVLDEFGVDSGIIQKGQTVTFEFVATTAGEYQFYCSVANHRAQGMVGRLVVN